MIFFTCNYCEELTFVPVGDNAGKIIRIQCPKCKKYCYLKLSRIDPCSWKEEDVEINEKEKTITILKEMKGV